MSFGSSRFKGGGAFPGDPFGIDPGQFSQWASAAADAFTPAKTAPAPGFDPADAFPAPAPAPAPAALADTAYAVGERFVASVVPVQVEIYTVRRDGRACPECGPYDGSLWDEGAGPMPPLHPNCRCQRLPHHVEWRSRG